MRTYNSNEEVEKDIKNGVLDVDDDIEIAFDGFSKETLSKKAKVKLPSGEVVEGEIVM